MGKISFSYFLELNFIKIWCGRVGFSWFFCKCWLSCHLQVTFLLLRRLIALCQSSKMTEHSHLSEVNIVLSSLRVNLTELLSASEDESKRQV